MAPLYISSADLYAAVSHEDAIEVLDATFAAPDVATAPQRSVLNHGDEQLLVMPAWRADAVGVKLVTVQPANPTRGLPLIQGVYVLFSGDTLEPIAVLEAAALTALRTAAVSAVATKYLAPTDAGRLVVFGAGVQAEAHVHALGAVRTLTDIAVVGQAGKSSEALVERLAAAGVAARLGSPADVAAAELVCTCTTSAEPLFDGSDLLPGAHVNAIGAHTPEAREVDSTTVRRARVVVETREAALAEAGDLLIPLARGEVDPDRVPEAELGEVVRTGLPGASEADITLFKSVGVAFEDLALARFAYDRIRTSEPQNE